MNIDKAKIAERANMHTTNMTIKYFNTINKCVKNTTIYPIDEQIPVVNAGDMKASFELVNLDSVSAIFEFATGSEKEKTAVLNFASFKEPGGLFLKGSTAQEEALCHESFLYNVLRNFQRSYYDVNNKNLNRGLYKNTALYTPNVIFFKNSRLQICDVITCAAPNRNVGIKYTNVSIEENNKVLYERISYIKNIALHQNVKTLILGAFGCGVFKQNATTVAKYIKKIFEDTGMEIILAVPGDNENYRKFKEIF